MITEEMLRACIDAGLITHIDADALWTMPEWLNGSVGQKWIEMVFDNIEAAVADNPTFLWLGTMLQESLLQYLEN